MEKMYTKSDVVRLISKERDRCIVIAGQKSKELEKTGRQKPALKGSLKRAAEATDQVMLKIFGGKRDERVSYEFQLEQQVYRDYFGDEAPVDKVLLDGCVFPSEEKTIQVVNDANYGGAHCYIFRECLGFADGKTSYVESKQVIQFIQKLDDGTIIPGLQSEQLVLALLDRTRKLNARFPSAQNEKMMTGLQMFLDACRERVEDRMNRGVMGNLKK